MKEKETTVKVEHSVTDFDKKVVQLLSAGKSVKEVAKELSLRDVRKLQFRVDTLRTALGCGNVAELVATFLRNKLIN